ncbi:MAG: NUDIX domain-containing protein [Cytophagales bacterium]|nr:MAG: NUDIX domain-containing protein [Cytophagales bacterium]TAF61710.1 MAG: NUDIX domain-containing protein [Cytophagales bacterium]
MKIFVDRCILSIYEKNGPSSFGKEQYVFSEKKFLEIYKKAKSTPALQGQEIFFESLDYKEAESILKKNFLIIKAAGGIIARGSKVLFIYRQKTWDLPKGKMDGKEDSPTAALREVEEECGIKPQIEQFIGETWHAYTLGKSRDILKQTFWYAMQDHSDLQTVPQLEEGIEKAEWFESEYIKNHILPNTYPSIQAIYKKYLDANFPK